MLRTDDQLLLSEALSPPDGYEADLLVGTTYSLHLSALLAVPLGLTFADWEATDGGPTADPVAMLEAVRRHSERITVFCQAGATAATDQPPLVASWLEPVVVPVKAPSDGVFHPKVWVARYRHPRERQIYRVVCGSRNLTFDRCWDTVLVVDGSPTTRGGLASETAPLADFLAALPGLAVGTVEPERATAIAELATELRRVRFTPPEGFSGISFWPMGIAGHRDDPLAQTRISRLLVMSPFVGQRRLEQFNSEDAGGALIARGEELERIVSRNLGAFSNVYALDEPENVAEVSEHSAVLTGLHAKLYVADAGWDAHVWTGSANATTAAFERNVEFLVRLDGKRSVCGVDAVLGGPDDRYALRQMLVEVPPRDVAADPDARVELERELDALVHQLAERQIAAHVRDRHGGIDLEVELSSNPALDLPAELQITCWPLTGVPGRDAQQVPPGTASLATFSGLSLAAITAFYVFRFELTRDHITVVKTVIIRADLTDLPDGRREAILRDLLRDPEQVLRLLQALLAFDRDALVAELGAGPQSGGGRGGHDGRETPVLEAMLRALDEAPQKLAAVANFMEDLSDVSDLLPPGLSEIWEPIYEAYEETLR